MVVRPIYRGSQKHVLDWVETPRFASEMLELVTDGAIKNPPTLALRSWSRWAPTGYREPDEFRLDRDAARLLEPGAATRTAPLRDWWLVHHAGANTPNWDLVVSVEIDGGPGLVIVEAKANRNEMNADGKRSPRTKNGAENHERIGEAIAVARQALNAHAPGISISRDRHYQLSNRIAFAWKLASLGVPTVLLYLGFYGDEGIHDVSPAFVDDADWQRRAGDKFADVGADVLLDRRLDSGSAPFWTLIRSRPVLESSPPKSSTMPR